MKTSVSNTSTLRLAALAAAVLAGYVAVLSTGPVAANVRLTQIAPGESAFWYSVMAASGALVAAVSFIVFGRISNRLLETRGSRQRIFIFSAVSLAPLILLVSAADSVPTILVVWCLLQIPAAAILSTSTAVVLELLPERLVGLASGLFGAAAVMAIFYGVLIGTVTKNDPTIVLATSVATALLLALPAALTRENTSLKNTEPDATTITKTPKAFWMFLFATTFSLAVSALSNDYFFQLSFRLLGGNTEAAATLAQQLYATSAGVFLLCSIAGGLLAKSAARSLQLFKYSLLISAAGLALTTLIQETGTLLIGAILIGIGTGLNVGSQLPVMRLTLDGREELGQEAGIFNLASIAPAILVPSFAALLIIVSEENWPILLGATVTALAVLGAALARTIRIR